MEPSRSRDTVALYAINALDKRQRAELDRHLGDCARCQAELEKLSEARRASELDIEPVDPSPALRQRILTAIRSETQDTHRPSRLSWMVRRRSSSSLVVTIAAVAILTGSLYGLRDLARGGESVEADAQRVISRADTVRAPLQGASGLIALNTHGEAWLVVHHLPMAPRGHTYEIWVLNGTHTSAAGTFAGGGATSSVKLTTRLTPGSSVVAVSLENAGGSQQPHGPLRFATAVV